MEHDHEDEIRRTYKKVCQVSCAREFYHFSFENRVIYSQTRVCVVNRDIVRVIIIIQHTFRGDISQLSFSVFHKKILLSSEKKPRGLNPIRENPSRMKLLQYFTREIGFHHSQLRTKASHGLKSDYVSWRKCLLISKFVFPNSECFFV